MSPSLHGVREPRNASSAMLMMDSRTSQAPWPFLATDGSYTWRCLQATPDSSHKVDAILDHGGQESKWPCSQGVTSCSEVQLVTQGEGKLDKPLAKHASMVLVMSYSCPDVFSRGGACLSTGSGSDLGGSGTGMAYVNFEVACVPAGGESGASLSPGA